MFALEKRVHGSDEWRCCALCGRREPVERVAAGLNDAKNWRVVDFPGEVDTAVEYANAA